MTNLRRVSRVFDLTCKVILYRMKMGGKTRVPRGNLRSCLVRCWSELVYWVGSIGTPSLDIFKCRNSVHYVREPSGPGSGRSEFVFWWPTGVKGKGNVLFGDCAA